MRSLRVPTALCLDSLPECHFLSLVRGRRKRKMARRDKVEEAEPVPAAAAVMEPARAAMADDASRDDTGPSGEDPETAF